jgi:hypothetical protein
VAACSSKQRLLEVPVCVAPDGGAVAETDQPAFLPELMCRRRV